MAKSKREKQRQEVRDMSASYRASGMTWESPEVKASLVERMKLIPNRETRSLTARIAGDPIPNDPRRPWLNEARERFMEKERERRYGYHV